MAVGPASIVHHVGPVGDHEVAPWWNAAAGNALGVHACEACVDASEPGGGGVDVHQAQTGAGGFTGRHDSPSAGTGAHIDDPIWTRHRRKLGGDEGTKTVGVWAKEDAIRGRGRER